MFFRIYPLDHKGHYRLPIEVECGSAADALAAAEAQAERLAAGFDLWELSRFLGRYQIDAAGRAGPMHDQPDAPKSPE